MKPRILITHTRRWPNAARLVIAFRRANCEVLAHCIVGHPLRSLLKEEAVYLHSNLSPVRCLRLAIDKSAPDFIVACDDRAFAHLHRLHQLEAGSSAASQRIRAVIERSLGNPTSYPLLAARSELATIAGAHDVLLPRTGIIRTAADLKQWVDREGFPAVIKIDGSWGGTGVIVVNTLKEAKAAFTALSAPVNPARALKRLVMDQDLDLVRQKFSGAKKIVTIQAFVPGRLGNCAVACWQGRIVAGIAVEVVATQGQLGNAVAVQVTDRPQMLAAAAKVVRGLGLSGFCGFDFVIEEKSHRAVLLEINPRATQINHLNLGPGRDLVAALRAQLTGEPVAPSPAVTDLDLIALFPHQWVPPAGQESLTYFDVPSEEPELVRAFTSQRLFTNRFLSRTLVTHS